MTTTGDLFVNIKGNNQGLKRSLQQSSRDITRFGKQTEQTMKGGLGFGDIAALAGISNIGNIAKAGNTLRNAHMIKQRGTWTDAMNIVRGQKSNGDFVRGKMRHAAHDGNIAEYHRLRRMDANHRANRRETLGKLKGHRDATAQAQSILSMPRLLLGASTAIAAVTGTILAVNGTKWAKRINQSAMSYSGAAIGNQARLDAMNMRKDIQLARQNSNSAITRQNAANFRMNSGAGGNVTNYLGAAWDAGVGAASNAVFGIPGLIMNVKQVSETFGGPK